MKSLQTGHGIIGTVSNKHAVIAGAVPNRWGEENDLPLIHVNDDRISRKHVLGSRYMTSVGFDRAVAARWPIGTVPI